MEVESWEELAEETPTNDLSSDYGVNIESVIEIAYNTIVLEEFLQEIELQKTIYETRCQLEDLKSAKWIERKLRNFEHFKKLANPNRNLRSELESKKESLTLEQKKRIDEKKKNWNDKEQKRKQDILPQIKELKNSIQSGKQSLNDEEVEMLEKLLERHKIALREGIFEDRFEQQTGNVSHKMVDQFITTDLLKSKDFNNNNNNNSIMNDNGSYKSQPTDLFILLMKKKRGTSKLFDAIYEDKYHWHSSKLIKEYEVGGEHKGRENTLYHRMWRKYSESMEAELKPNLIAEFSQNLDTELTVLDGKSFKSKSQPIIHGNNTISKLKSILSKLHSPTIDFPNKEITRSVIRENMMMHVKELNRIYQQNPTEESKANMLEAILDMKYHFDLTKGEKSVIIDALRLMGFNDEAGYIDGKKMSSLSSASIQLRYLGPRFLRKQQPTYFKGTGYYPDDWQLEVLKIIDRRESAVVVTPTSSGKSFISFYAISSIISKPRQVINRSSLRSRIVFVSPSLALANQMVANVFLHYKKIIDVGVFVKDYQMNLKDCELLVCTPNEFQLLLLSPVPQNWANSLEYVIFDEVHTMVQESDEDEESITLGANYARILSLINCPFLALSATIANPDIFVDWLSKMLNKKVYGIPSSNQKIRRWTDLQLYNYSSNTISHIHPISLLNSQKEACSIGFLSPSDSLQLYQAMSNVLREDTLQFKPELFFSNVLRITRVEQSEYSNQLLKFIESLDDDKFGLLQQNLETGSTQQVGIDQSLTPQKMLDLLTQLQNNGMGPALLFHNDIDLLLNLMNQLLEKMELIQPPKVVPTSKSGSNQATKKADKLNEDSLDERNMRDEVREVKKQAINVQVNNWKEYALSVSDYYPRTSASTDDFQFWLERLFEKRGWSSRYPLLRLLARRIGLHDNNLPKPYRDLVEYCFRSGFLSFVFSTRSLMVGINMPIKSVVFLTSKHISSINYQQLSGRAGRRGHDSLGYVIFYGFTKEEIHDLHIQSKQHLQTVTTLCTTTVLKMMMLEHSDGFAEFDKDKTKDRLSHLMYPPLTKSGIGDRLHMEVQLKLGLEILYGLNLIDKSGRPLSLSSIISHTPEISPSGANYLLTYLILRGALNDIIKPFTVYYIAQLKSLERSSLEDKRRKSKEDLVHIFAHIVSRVPNKESLAPLEPLPQVILTHISNYNKLLKDIRLNLISTLNLPQDVRYEVPVCNLKDNNNIWMYHLYKFRDYGATIKRSGLHDTILYPKIEHFKNVLKKIQVCFEQISLDPEFDPYYNIFKELVEDFNSINLSVNTYA